MINLTESAIAQIQNSILKRKKGLGIRIGTKITGCSGLAYVLEYVDQPQQDDQCINCADCLVYVDPKSCPYLQGTVIDYVRQGLNEGFEFRNPNERDRCGCGESFRV